MVILLGLSVSPVLPTVFLGMSKILTAGNIEQRRLQKCLIGRHGGEVDGTGRCNRSGTAISIG
jgi:hypothetical protein